jgi:hypothetical protein
MFNKLIEGDEMKSISFRDVSRFKKSFWFFLIGVLITTGFFARASTDSTQINLTVTDRGAAFSLIQQTVSSFFALSISDLQPYRQSSAPDEMIPLLYMASESNCTPHQIWLKHQGSGWGKLANELDLPPNFHGKYMSAKHRQKYRTVTVINDYDYEEMMTVKFLNDYYGVTPEAIYFWRRKGLSYGDLFLGLNLSARLHKGPQEFFQLRISGCDWQFVARKYHLPYSILTRPVQPLRKVIVIYKDNDHQETSHQDKHHQRNHGKKHHEHDDD